MYRFVGLAELYYAGSHGMDIMGPKLAENCVTPADEPVRMVLYRIVFFFFLLERGKVGRGLLWGTHNKY